VSFSALVVDDELMARDELTFLLERTGMVRVVGEASCGSEALQAIARHRPDVLFLDVQMPEMDGFDVAKALLDQPSPPVIVFVTAYDEYALQAFEVHAVDYLLKPLDPARVERSVTRIGRWLAQPGRETLDRLEQFLNRVAGPRLLQRIPLDGDGRTVLVSPGEILYASSGPNATIVVAAQGEYTTSLSLQELEERLGHENFLRVHRQYLANMEKVREFIPFPGGTASLAMGTRYQVPVARTQVKRVKELLGLD